MKTYAIIVLKGDGIGPEIIDATLQVLEAAAKSAGTFRLDFHFHPAGAEYYRQTGVNMSPDTFHAVIAQVPFVDVMNTMLDADLPLTTEEWIEWGNPNEKAAYDYMASYSPYDNIRPKAYPAILVRTSLNDSQVMYWEPAKYVARLRATKPDSNVLLFKIKLEPGGHGGASGRYDKLHDVAYDYAFILSQLPAPPAVP